VIETAHPPSLQHLLAARCQHGSARKVLRVVSEPSQPRSASSVIAPQVHAASRVTPGPTLDGNPRARWPVGSRPPPTIKMCCAAQPAGADRSIATVLHGLCRMAETDGRAQRSEHRHARTSADHAADGRHNAPSLRVTSAMRPCLVQGRICAARPPARVNRAGSRHDAAARSPQKKLVWGRHRGPSIRPRCFSWASGRRAGWGWRWWDEGERNPGGSRNAACCCAARQPGLPWGRAHAAAGATGAFLRSWRRG